MTAVSNRSIITVNLEFKIWISPKLHEHNT